MKYRLTLLNVTAFLFLAGCCFYTAFNYSMLSNNEGWGILAMIVFCAFGLGALTLDLIIQKFILSKNKQTILGGIIIVVFDLALFSGSSLFI